VSAARSTSDKCLTAFAWVRFPVWFPVGKLTLRGLHVVLVASYWRTDQQPLIHPTRSKSKLGAVCCSGIDSVVRISAGHLIERSCLAS
jgi:hypothetical protein